MAQLARPDGNITASGGFSSTDWQAIDEAIASDSDYAWSTDNSAAELEVSLSNVNDPQSNSGHVFRYRIARTNDGVVDGGGSASTVVARLMQGTTEIAADVQRTATGTWTTYGRTLSASEADAITDYSDLRIEFAVTGGGGSPSNRRGLGISWAELEVPDLLVAADVSWAEVEVPDAPRSAELSWAEVEIPDTNKAAEVSWTELEVPDAPRAAELSWSELETPSAPRTVELSWAEVEVPTPPRAAEVSWVALELPDAPRLAEISWAELEVPSLALMAELSWAELEVPDAPRAGELSWAELEAPTAPRAAEVSWAEFQTQDPLRWAELAWAEVEVPGFPGAIVLTELAGTTSTVLDLPRHEVVVSDE